MTTRVTVIGASGRMGRMLVGDISADSSLMLVGAVEREEDSAIGQDAGAVAGTGQLGVPIVSDLATALAEADVTIEFTTPEASIEHLRVVRDHGKAAVVGTTGFSPQQLAEIGQIATSIPVFQSPNMSLGVNALFKLLPLFVQALGPSYDIEVVEAHHHGKKDAPSGTAVKIGEILARAAGVDLATQSTYGRKDIQPRQPGEIGFHAIRAGAIVGEHTVLFANEGEQIEVSHRAYSRQTFALGALRAAGWIAGQKPGLYSMQDLLQ